MLVKNNYNECITNLACSIRKYFELDYKHNTLEYIDKILEQKKPKNVVTILFDGMGDVILNNALDKNSFLQRNKLKSITTVFPATTVAATTSITTGLNPSESCMLGWNMYYKDINKTITTFFSTEKGSANIIEEAVKYKKMHMKTKSIVSDINDSGKYKGYELLPFGENSYKDVDEMFDRIEKICNQGTKNYIYAYDDEPDHLMHILGADCKEAKDMIRYRNIKIEELSKKLKDTIIFVIADHGHKNVENIDLNNYPEIVDCMIRTTSIEPRAINFFIEESKKDKFVKLFNDNFSNDFDLHTKKDVIDSKLFGDGVENEIFRDCLGDYLAIAKGNKAIIYGDEKLVSHHAGYTDDEIYVPLIVIDC